MSAQPMKVFISWSGDRSHELAKALRNWLRLAVQSTDPWTSERGIEPGERWSTVLGSELKSSTFGIFCITPENITAPWLLYEAGALSKSVEESRVVPLLFGVPKQAIAAPFAQFQALEADEGGFLDLVRGLHSAAQTSMSDEDIRTVFATFWPRLKSDIDRIQPSLDATPKRSEREILEEVLLAVRGLRIRPDKSAIAAALRDYCSEVRAQLEYLRGTSENSPSPSAVSAFNLTSLEDRLASGEAALRALERGGQGTRAALVSVLGVGDLSTVLSELSDDISYRQYQYELRGPREVAEKADRDIWIVEKLSTYLKELLQKDKPAPASS